MLICRALVEGGGRVVRCLRLHLLAGWRGMSEGVVVCPSDQAEPHAAKLLRPGFRRIDDAAWTGGRPRNIVVEAAHS